MGDGRCASLGCMTHDPSRICQCTPECTKAKNCCLDYHAFCTSTGTCREYGCGGLYDPMRDCQCSADCVDHFSCCPDYEATCKGGQIAAVRPKAAPLANSQRKAVTVAKASCAAYGCGKTPVKGRKCQCDKNCATNGNCCPDYTERCKSIAMDIVSKAYDFASFDTSKEMFYMQADLTSEDCFESCGGKSGMCSVFCGAGRACCMSGGVAEAPECARAYSFVTDHHECVGLWQEGTEVDPDVVEEGAELQNNEDKETGLGFSQYDDPSFNGVDSGHYTGMRSGPYTAGGGGQFSSEASPYNSQPWSYEPTAHLDYASEAASTGTKRSTLPAGAWWSWALLVALVSIACAVLLLWLDCSSSKKKKGSPARDVELSHSDALDRDGYDSLPTSA